VKTRSTALKDSLNKTYGLCGVFVDLRRRKVKSVKRIKKDGVELVEITSEGMKTVIPAKRRRHGSTKKEQAAVIKLAGENGKSAKVMVNGVIKDRFRVTKSGKVTFGNNRQNESLKKMLEYHNVEIVYEDIEMRDIEDSEIDAGEIENDDEDFS
jgi:hypothetical protein